MWETDPVKCRLARKSTVPRYICMLHVQSLLFQTRQQQHVKFACSLDFNILNYFGRLFAVGMRVERRARGYFYVWILSGCEQRAAPPRCSSWPGLPRDFVPHPIPKQTSTCRGTIRNRVGQTSAEWQIEQTDKDWKRSDHEAVVKHLCVAVAPQILLEGEDKKAGSESACYGAGTNVFRGLISSKVRKIFMFRY